jgi:hypothetical protein
MNTKMLSTVAPFSVLIYLISVHTGGAQGTFLNLNFESARVPFVPTGQYGNDVFVSNGVPGWTVYIGGGQLASMWHNNMSLGGAAVAILGPAWFPDEILQGNYTVSLMPSTFGPPTTTAIGQTGRVPLDAESVTFYARGAYALTFAGQSIPVFTLGTTSTYTIFGGDISGFAGQAGELLFQGGGLLDAVQFSTQSIPEPGVFIMFALGGLLLGWRALGRKR